MQTGAIILCGGKSSRMGRDKAMLPFGDETMLQRVVRIVSEVVPADRLVVVHAGNQALPPLPDEIITAEDRRPDRGPLEGLAAGLRALPGDVEAAYVTSCDAPLLRSAFIRRMLELLSESQSRAKPFHIAVPCNGQFRFPLAAAYLTLVLPHIEELLASDQLRVSSLCDQVSTAFVPMSDLREVDPQLDSLWNLNTPSEYQAALLRLNEP